MGKIHRRGRDMGGEMEGREEGEGGGIEGKG